MELMIVPEAAPAPASIEEGVAELQRLEDEARSLMRSIRERQKDLVRTRFKQGRIVSHLTEGAAYGDGAVRLLSEGTGISEGLLYECRRFFELPQFGRSSSQLEAWLVETEERKGAVNWSYARQLVRNRLDADPEIKRVQVDDRVRRLEKRAEALEHDAEDLRMELGQMEPEQRREASGAAVKAQEVAKDLKAEAERLRQEAAQARGPQRDEKYLAFVREFYCCACQQPGADAHHLMAGGTGTKGSDYLTVPLCREHHGELHQTGPRAFEARYEVSLWQVSAYLLVEFFTGRPPRS